MRVRKKFKDFQGPGMIRAKIFKDFQGLQNALSKFKGFQGFSRCIQTLLILCSTPAHPAQPSDMLVQGKRGPVRPKMTWKEQCESDCKEWKLTAVDPHDDDNDNGVEIIKNV